MVFIFVGLAWSCRERLVVEVSLVCSFFFLKPWSRKRWSTFNLLVFLPRRLCLQRWTFCNLAAVGDDGVKHLWKRYFLRRSHLEMKMTEGRSGGYTCKSLRGHTGKVISGALLFSVVKYLWHMFSIRQSGGFGVPASSPLEHQHCSLQRLYWWHSPSMEHPKCQCSTLSIS